MDDVGAVLAVIIGVVAGLMILFFLLREVMCWYWKINQRVGLMEDILKELSRIPSQPESAASAKPSSTALEETMKQGDTSGDVKAVSEGMVACPKCGVPQLAKRKTCLRCGTALQSESG